MQRVSSMKLLRDLCEHTNSLTLTFEHGADLPHSQTALAGKLTEGQLEEEEGDAAEHQHDEVR